MLFQAAFILQKNKWCLEIENKWVCFKKLYAYHFENVVFVSKNKKNTPKNKIYDFYSFQILFLCYNIVYKIKQYKINTVKRSSTLQIKAQRKDGW